MKQIGIILFIILFSNCMSVRGQHNIYGLEESDIRNIIGAYFVDIEKGKVLEGFFDFSWGEGKVRVNDSIIIDYEVNKNSVFYSYIIMNDIGVPLLAKEIRKIDKDIYEIILSYIFSKNNLEDIGFIILTVIDDNHISIDASNLKKGLMSYPLLTKIAGPSFN